MKIFLSMLAVVLAGCASGPAAPSWQLDSRSALEGFTDAYLKGDSSAARSEFARARSETAATGDAVAVAQVELVRCAAQTASLDVDACSGFTALAGDATAAQRAYADYLAGRWTGLNVTLLPEAQRGVPLASIADPLSRLVAAGAALRAGTLTPEGITTATDTASQQGWRRPLLAWLGVSIQRAEALGDAAEVARLRRRVALAQP
ncbi:MAG: hypothetical protein M3Y65_04270 [Pseudomonadota bacterium]|nr:hypothetical protein [Pseudomonadota bacterium]